jgi:hypothetical protein
MLKSGIEDFEKIYIKRQQNKTNQQFNSVLSQFDFKKVSVEKSRGSQINSARQMLNN